MYVFSVIIFAMIVNKLSNVVDATDDVSQNYHFWHRSADHDMIHGHDAHLDHALWSPRAQFPTRIKHVNVSHEQFKLSLKTWFFVLAYS